MNSPTDILDNKSQNDFRNPAVMNLSDLVRRCQNIKAELGQGAVDEFLNNYCIGDNWARLVHAGDSTSKWQRMSTQKVRG